MCDAFRRGNGRRLRRKACRREALNLDWCSVLLSPNGAYVAMMLKGANDFDQPGTQLTLRPGVKTASSLVCHLCIPLSHAARSRCASGESTLLLGLNGRCLACQSDDEADADMHIEASRLRCKRVRILAGRNACPSRSHSRASHWIDQIDPSNVGKFPEPMKHCPRSAL